MSSAPIPVPAAKRSFRTRARDFWARVTEGLEIEQLWGQFRAEAEASYGLYSKDVDWDAIRSERKRWKRPLLAGWALFQTLLMKLSPARRVLLLVAIVLLVVQPEIHTGERQISFSLGGLGALILIFTFSARAGRPRHHETRSRNRARNSTVACTQ